MQSRNISRWFLAGALTLGAGLLALPVVGATKGKAATIVAPSHELVPAVVPQSVFEIPGVPKEGRDPFFPNSKRPYGTAAIGPRTNTLNGVISLALKGLAGQEGERFATISAVGAAGALRSIMLAAGEQDEIVTPTGPVKIRCLEIKDESVTVEVNGVRRELRLRAGF